MCDMRLLLILSAIFFIIAFVCNVVPTALLGIDALGWAILGLLAWVVDVLLGAPAYGPAFGVRRP